MTPRSTRLLGLVLLVVMGGCTRRPRDEARRLDPVVRPGPASPLRDAGLPPRDAGRPDPKPADAGVPGSLALPEREEITAERVIKGPWITCHVYRRYVVLVRPEKVGESVAVKPAGLDPVESCRRWKGPFLVQLRSPLVEPMANPEDGSWGFTVRFGGLFRDLLIIYLWDSGTGGMRLYDLPTGKKRFFVETSGWSQWKDEGKGRFTFWETIEGVPLTKEQQEEEYTTESEEAVIRRLWSRLASIKLRHRLLYDGLTPRLCNLNDEEVKRSECAWWGQFEVDLRDPRVRALPVLKCSCLNKSVF